MTKLMNAKRSLTGIAFALLWTGWGSQAMSENFSQAITSEGPGSLFARAEDRTGTKGALTEPEVFTRGRFDAAVSVSERWVPKCPLAPPGGETECSPPDRLREGVAPRGPAA